MKFRTGYKKVKLKKIHELREERIILRGYSNVGRGREEEGREGEKFRKFIYE